MSIHFQAISYLDKAIALTAKGDLDSFRYAALDLRHAIECLVYELLSDYREELFDEVLEGWQPKLILDAIADCDPDQLVMTSLLVARDIGEDVPKIWISLGTQHIPTHELLRNCYSRLGSFLHMNKEMRDHILPRLRRSVELSIEELEIFRGDRIRASLGIKNSFDCTECGRKVVRRESALKKNRLLRCTNKNCRAVFEWALEGDMPNFKRATQRILCPNCKIETEVLARIAFEGDTFRCSNCDTAFIVESRLGLSRIEPRI